MKLLRIVPSAALGVVLVAGCGAPAPAAAPAPPAVPTTSAPAAAPAPGVVVLTGDLKQPGEITLTQLAALPQQSTEVSFGSGSGPQRHAESGPALADVIPAAALDTTDAKNDQLRFAVLAIGEDGYAATVAYADGLADFGNRGLILALTEDGATLERPRLVVPGDVKGGRYVEGVTELKVVRVE